MRSEFVPPFHLLGPRGSGGRGWCTYRSPASSFTIIVVGGSVPRRHGGAGLGTERECLNELIVSDWKSCCRQLDGWTICDLCSAIAYPDRFLSGGLIVRWLTGEARQRKGKQWKRFIVCKCYNCKGTVRWRGREVSRINSPTLLLLINQTGCWNSIQVPLSPVSEAENPTR